MKERAFILQGEFFLTITPFISPHLKGDARAQSKILNPKHQSPNNIEIQNAKFEKEGGIPSIAIVKEGIPSRRETSSPPMGED